MHKFKDSAHWCHLLYDWNSHFSVQSDSNVWTDNKYNIKITSIYSCQWSVTLACQWTPEKWQKPVLYKFHFFLVLHLIVKKLSSQQQTFVMSQKAQMSLPSSAKAQRSPCFFLYPQSISSSKQRVKNIGLKTLLFSNIQLIMQDLSLRWKLVSNILHSGLVLVLEPVTVAIGRSFGSTLEKLPVYHRTS